MQVKLVDGGWRHTVAVTEHGVFAWGWNKFGQLGLGTVDENPSTPHKLAPFAGAGDPIEHITAGWKHTMFVTATGAVFATGRGNNGQLCMPVKADLCAPMALSCCPLWCTLMRTVRRADGALTRKHASAATC